VYVWGSNTEGQLGLGPEAEEAVYTPVLLNLHFKVIVQKTRSRGDLVVSS
jgi:alpha-tubulin suppressor-like RCC1 family protein